MKDLVITGRRIRRELRLLLGCLILALAVNAGAIIAYRTQWRELFTTGHITGALALALYFLAGLLRLAVSGVRRLVQRRRNAPPEPPG